MTQMMGNKSVLWALTKPQGRAAALMLITIAVFFLSLVMSCQELRYMVSGKTTDANGALQLRTNRDKDGTLTKTNTLTYTWMENGLPHQNSMDMPLDYKLDSTNTVKIQYLPGRDASRLQGQSNKVWVFIFFGSILLAIIAGWILVKTT